jgi:CBS domain-containing protein
MTDRQVFSSRLTGRPLLDSDGLTIGRIRDVVILPAAGTDPPRALGLVVTLQRRQIFVNLGRIAEISVDGAHLRGATVDLDRFTRRTGEILASELYGRHTEDGTVVDVAIASSEQRRVGWEVCAVAVTQGRSLRSRGVTIVPWDKHSELFHAGPLGEQLASLRELQPADLATAVEGMSPSRRSQLAAALDDEELADLLEEMPEQDQIRLLASLELERSADVVEEMQPDDAADLLAEMPAEQRERLLTAMEAVQAADLRRLLRYDATTAGGLMTSQPLVVTPDMSVAEVLARIRDPEMPVTSAMQVYVCEPPIITPTGRYLGSVGFQRLLRRPPATEVGDCVEASVFVRPDLPERELAARLAAYNLVSVAVCDEVGRLLGAVTVDDVLDHLLPAGWRRTEGLECHASPPAASASGPICPFRAAPRGWAPGTTPTRSGGFRRRSRGSSVQGASWSARRCSSSSGSRSTPSASSSTGIRTRSSCST